MPRARAFFLVLLTVLAAGACVVVMKETPAPEGVLTAPPPAPPAAVEVDLSFFFDDLSPYGDWLWLEPYGWVWTPAGVPFGWRPYTVGRWIWTDDGWFWLSDEVWGWGPYHYGRWFFDGRIGWVWVPGREWAPAWIVFRSGDGWIGWAPLPPRARWRAGVGLDLDDPDLLVEPFAWCFIEASRFLDPRIGVRVAPSARNVTLLRVTISVTRFEASGRRVVVRGPDLDDLARRTGAPVPRYRIVDSSSRGDLDRSPRGVEIRAYRPTVRDADPGRAPRKKIVLPDRRPGGPPGRVPPSPDDLSGPAGRRPAPESGSPQEPRRRIPPVPADRSGPRESDEPVGDRAPDDPERLRREAIERMRLEREQERERARLEREHLKEVRKPPAGVELDDLRRRQAEERRALAEQVERERAARRQRETARPEESGEGSGSKEGKEPKSGAEKPGRGRPAGRKSRG